MENDELLERLCLSNNTISERLDKMIPNIDVSNDKILERLEL